MPVGVHRGVFLPIQTALISQADVDLLKGRDLG
jgi:hypothetical protein